MRTFLARPRARLLPLLLGLVLLLTACSTGQGVATSAGALSEARSAAATPTAVAQASPAAAGGAATVVKPSTASPNAVATPSDAVATAVKAVIQRADDEQQQAIAANDPTLMRDTATDNYYNELVQTNQDLVSNGVTAITLTALEWGPIAQQSATSVQVTAFETWSTTFSDGTTSDQARERNIYTLVQENGTWKIQADEHPDTTTVVDQPIPGGTSGGTSPMPAARTGDDQSSNWSGYAATGGTFTAVSGTWTVPQVAATSGSGADATWVGIGGVNSRDLIQAGTEATVTGGQVRYDAWVEMLPRSAQRVPFTINPGDSVNVAITQQGDGTWLIAFQNRTTGLKYQVTETYTSSLSSAEWIEEAPSTGQRLVPLDDFGTVQFGEGTAVKDGQQVGIAQAGGTAITMIDRSGRALATPSALGGDGASFSVQRTAVTPASPAPTTPRRSR